MNPYETGILDSEIHKRLVADIDRYARMAGIPRGAIWTHLSEFVGDEEKKWVKGFLSRRRSPPPGLAYVGPWDGVEQRMVGICGAMVRNFVDARLVTPHRAIEEPPDCTLLAIPGLLGAQLPKWMAAKLADLVMDRSHRGKSTVLEVGNLESFKALFGAPLVDHLGTGFKVVRP